MSVAILTHPLSFGAVDRSLAEVRAEPAPTAPELELPEEIRSFLARLRLLEGVPFSHIVPDVELLPPETIRFFHVDREWTDALIEGALSVGTINTLDREQLQALYARVRDAVDREERRVRVPGGDPPGFGPAGAITGFLLRSAAVSGWPGLHVRAYSRNVDDDVSADAPEGAMRLLRLERLAPAVLLALFDGVPRVVHIEEPRAGIQFGVDLQAGAENTRKAQINLRNAQTAAPLHKKLDVPFRRGAPGVIHVADLARQLAGKPDTHVTGGTDTAVDGAEMAMQLLQFPYRQVFGPEGGGVRIRLEDLFTPTIELARVAAWHEGGR